MTFVIDTSTARRKLTQAEELELWKAFKQHVYFSLKQIAPDVGNVSVHCRDIDWVSK